MSSTIPQFTAPTQDNIGFARARTQHPQSKAFLLAQVEPDTDVIIKMNEEEFASELYVIDMVDQIPAHLPERIKSEIKEFLTENKMDDRDGDVCIISPFIDVFRGFIVEIFDRAVGEKVVDGLINNGFDGVIKGLIFKDLSTPNRSYHIDSELDAHDRREKRLNEEAMKQAIDKARIINKMW